MRKHDRRGVIPLRLIPGAAGAQFVEGLAHDVEVRPGLGSVQADEDVPGLDVVALVHEQRADHAADGVLDLLHLGLDHELPGAITAPEKVVNVAQPPTPRMRAAINQAEKIRCRRTDAPEPPGTIDVSAG